MHGLYIFAVDKELREKLLEVYKDYCTRKKIKDEENRKEWSERVDAFNRYLDTLLNSDEPEDQEDAEISLSTI